MFFLQNVSLQKIRKLDEMFGGIYFMISLQIFSKRSRNKIADSSKVSLHFRPSQMSVILLSHVR
jgi:hypothetical protein